MLDHPAVDRFQMVKWGLCLGDLNLGSSKATSPRALAASARRRVFPVPYSPRTALDHRPPRSAIQFLIHRAGEAVKSTANASSCAVERCHAEVRR